MKKNGLNTRLIGIVLICAMVLCTINIPLAAVSEGAAALGGFSGEPVYLYGNAPISEFDFSGKEELTTQWNGADDLVFGGIWYAQKSLPDGITMLNGATGKALVLAKDANDEQTDPGHGKPTKYALEFISGDERLKDAVSIKEPEGVLRINYDALAEPGEAVFRITLENDRYWYQQEKTLRVADFAENPPFVVPDVPVILRMEKGKAFFLLPRGGNQNSSLIYRAAAAVMTGGNINEVGENRRKSSNQNLLGAYPSITYTEQKRAYTATEEGVYDFEMELLYANHLVFTLPCRLCVSDEQISGPANLQPGETGRYSLRGNGGNARWSLEGKGATVDEGTGEVTINADTELGRLLMLTATPEDGGTPISMNIQVAVFGFDAAVTETVERAGFRFPVLNGVGWKTEQGDGGRLYRAFITDDSGLLNQENVSLGTSKLFVDDDASADEYDRQNIITGEDIQRREIRIDGNKAYLYTRKDADNNGWNVYQGLIIYPRNNRVLQVGFTAGRQNKPIDDVQPIGLDWLENYAAMIHYDKPADLAGREDAMLTLSVAENAAPVLSPGQNLQLTAAVANPEKVNAERGNGGVLWTVTDAVSGAATEVATITEDGLLTAAKKMNDAATVRVTATTEYFQTTASLDVTIYPPIQKVETDPKEVTLYAGSDQPVTVRAVVSPESVPPVGLIWQAKKEGIVEVVPGEDGTAAFKALTEGKTQVTVKEPGGKSAVVKVNVVEPVTEVTLSAKGKAAPGKTVTVSAALEPKKAGNKNLEWSLDVDETVATINAKGQVKIAKEATAGTVITVTCKALGAPEPVVSTLAITVE